jgi:hypothetical protein
MSDATFEFCSVCGLAWPDHTTDLQFGLPDEVVNRLDEVLDADAWMSGKTPSDSDLLRLPPFGAYIRAILPVRVDGALASKLPFQHAICADVVVEVVDPNRKPVITSSADT